MTHPLVAPPREPVRYPGFTLPTTTPIPDQIIDELLPQLSGAELKVVLYICRRTLGFRKISDNISLQQLLSGLIKKNGERLDYGTGLSKTTLLKTLRDLQDKGIIETIHRSSNARGDEATNYRLRFIEGVQPLVCQRSTSDAASVQTVNGYRPASAPPGQEIVPPPWSRNCTTPLVKKSRPQQTEIQETEIQETDARAIIEVSNNTSSGHSGFVGGGQDSESSFWLAHEHPKNTRPQAAFDTDYPSMTNTLPPTSDTPPSPTVERQQGEASALIAIGMTAKVAHRLAERYSLTRIEEKLDYLDFLQQYRPDKVKNHCGWLRTAIEDDFAAPDGYLSPAVWKQWTAEQAQLEQEEQAQAHAAAAARQQAQAHEAARAQAYRAWLTQTYGTTPADVAFWQQALAELDFTFTTHRDLFQRYIQPAEILTVTDTAVRLGFPETYGVAHLSHPGAKTRIERVLSAVAGRPVQVCYEVIPEPAVPLVEAATAMGESPGPAL